MKRSLSGTTRRLASATTVVVIGLLASRELHAQGGTMRGLTAKQIVCDMFAGWNLGNTMDSSPNETSWGNPTTTQAMIDAVKAMGFNAVRIPVTWASHIGAAPGYTIDKAWLDRVEVIANYVLGTSMYAIVNTHHDDAWVVITSAGQAAGVTEATAVWTQIANRFKNYGDHLIFETFNEPHGPNNPYGGGDATQQAVLNAYNAAALAAIRGTDGKNATRFVMLPTHGASPPTAAINALVIPNNDPNVLISIHTYDPNGFSLNASPTKGTVPVIGEWGSVASDDLASRVAHAQFYAQQARQRGAVPIWWDNGGCSGSGGFGILNRKANPVSWCFPTIAQALIAGAKAAVCPGGTPDGGSGTGGSPGTGGSSDTGGNSASDGGAGRDAGVGGGNRGSGGGNATGGSVGSGGASAGDTTRATGGSRAMGSGGAPGGTGGAAGVGTAHAGASAPYPSTAGCGCDLGTAPARSSWASMVCLLAAAALVAGRQRRR
jgi:endoglucanase